MRSIDFRNIYFVLQFQHIFQFFLVCSEAEKTKVTINHKQFGLPQQLIAEGIDFEFESNTDVTYRLLKTEDAPLNIVHYLLEIFNPKYEDLSDVSLVSPYYKNTLRKSLREQKQRHLMLILI